MDLNELRLRIDAVDDEMVRLFCERMRISAEIAQIKAVNGLAVYDPEREKRKLEDVMGKASEYREYIGALYARVFELSRDIQEKKLQK